VAVKKKNKKMKKHAAAISISERTYDLLRALARQQNTTIRWIVEMSMHRELGLEKPERRFSRRYRGVRGG
jgi:hypothetical protein